MNKTAKLLLTISIVSSLAAGTCGLESAAASEPPHIPTIIANRYKLDALSAEIDTLTQRLHLTNPEGTPAEMRTQFFSMLGELKRMEARLNALEDNAKLDHMSGRMIWADYRSVDHSIDALKSRLYSTEERIERNFSLYRK